MDLHKSYLQVAVLDGKGKVLKNSRIRNDLSKVGRFFDRIGGSGNSGDVKVVMESSYVWYNIYEYLSEERQLDVSLSNPFKTRAIASAKIKVKTYRDALYGKGNVLLSWSDLIIPNKNISSFQIPTEQIQLVFSTI